MREKFIESSTLQNASLTDEQAVSTLTDAPELFFFMHLNRFRDVQSMAYCWQEAYKSFWDENRERLSPYGDAAPDDAQTRQERANALFKKLHDAVNSAAKNAGTGMVHMREDLETACRDALLSGMENFDDVAAFMNDQRKPESAILNSDQPSRQSLSPYTGDALRMVFAYCLDAQPDYKFRFALYNEWRALQDQKRATIICLDEHRTRTGKAPALHHSSGRG